MSDLAKLIADFTADLPEALLQSLANELRSELAFKAGKEKVYPLPSGARQNQLRQILESAEEIGLQESAIGVAFQTAFYTHKYWRKKISVEMVWTGPSPVHTTLRRTDQVLLEVINKSRKSLWIVSFAAYRVRVVTDAINRAVQRGVEVKLVLESSEESGGRLSGDQILKIKHDLSSQCRFYVWPMEKREKNAFGISGVLHAKCAVADGKNLFISSANLTEAAHRLNIELGVLIGSGSHASRIEEQLKWLVNDQVLEGF